MLPDFILVLIAVRYALFHNTHTAMERVVYRAATLSSPNTAKRTAGSMQYVLTDRDADVLALVQAIEDCLFHGLKVNCRPPLAILSLSLSVFVVFV